MEDVVARERRCVGQTVAHQAHSAYQGSFAVLVVQCSVAPIAATLVSFVEQGIGAAIQMTGTACASGAQPTEGSAQA